jgi:hypothetical protein
LYNNATEGGALILVENSNASNLQNCIFANNSANKSGGAI